MGKVKKPVHFQILLSISDDIYWSMWSYDLGLGGGLSKVSVLPCPPPPPEKKSSPPSPS